MKHNIRWVAHRGNCENHIENTLESIQAAIDNGINHIEIDTQLTKEGLPIVFHDNDLKRMLNINSKVMDTHFDEIKHLALEAQHQKNKINYYTPALLQVVKLIEQHPNITLYVEVKNINFTCFSYKFVMQKILQVLNPILKQVVIIGFSYRFLREVQKNSTLTIAYVLPSWKHYSKKMLTNLQPDIIFSNIKYIPKNENFSTKKEPWIIYEVSHIEQAKQLMKQGIFGFESFTPSLLKHELQKINVEEVQNNH